MAHLTGRVERDGAVYGVDVVVLAEGLVVLQLPWSCVGIVSRHGGASENVYRWADIESRSVYQIISR